MQKIIALFLALLLTFSYVFAFAQETAPVSEVEIDLTKALEQIPVVYIYGDSLVGWGDKKDVREATLVFDNPVTGESLEEIITIRPQGSSSLSYPKKNFTIEFQTGEVEVHPEWGYQTKYCLKANYIDPTHAGNVVSARLAAQCYELYGLHEDLPNRGAVDGFPVWVTLNSIPEGLYTWNIPKAAWMFGMDEDDENHIVMACEDHSEAANFLQDHYSLDEEPWAIEVGPETTKTIARFSRLMEFIANSTDEEFVENFDQYLNLEACLIYYCFICIADALDNIDKNMLLATWDAEVWYPMLYDLDSLWGFKWDGKETWPETANGVVNSNHALYQRLRTCFEPQLLECYAKLRNGPLSLENIWAEFEAFAEEIPDEMFQWNNQRWNPDGERIRTYETMDRMIQEYLPRVDAAFGYTAESYCRP